MPFIVGITGGSGSGKTTIAEDAARDLSARGLRTAILGEDNYYLNAGQQAGFNPATYNFDEPAAKDFALLASQLRDFRAGRAIEYPTYDFVTHSRTAVTGTLDPAQIDVLIVEGIFTLWDADVRAALDLKVFVDTPLDECLARRILRDITERGRDVQEVVWRFRTFVRPGFLDYTLPTRAHADIVIADHGEGMHHLHSGVVDAVLIAIRV